MSISFMSSISLSGAMPASYKPAIKKIAPVSRKENRITEEKTGGNSSSHSSENTPDVIDKAEISTTAKKLFTDTYESGSAVSKQSVIADNGFSSVFKKAYLNNFDDEKIKDIPSHIRKGATASKWNAEKYVKDVRGGFIVSGVNADESSLASDGSSDKVRARYEMENVRFPGHLLSVLA